MDLYICLTPLQTLIVEKIIEKSSSETALCFCFSYRNKINVKYYERLKSKVTQSHYFIEPFCVRMIWDIYNYSKGKKFSSIYVANINHPFVLYMLSFLKFKNLYTFDDGAANISYNGAFYKKKSESLGKRVAHWLLGRRYTRERVLLETKKHYTIYANMPNIIQNIENISLFCDGNISSNFEADEISIFLGSIYDEFVKDESLYKIKQDVLLFLKSIDDIYYVPHPRESLEDFKEYYIPNELCENEVVESTIIRLLSIYSKINVYGFASTAQFNLMNFQRVKCIVLKHDFLDEVTLSNCDRLISMGASYQSI